MQVTLSSHSRLSVSILGNISEIDYNWKIKPLKDLIENFIDEDSYFDELFNALYKLQEWAVQKRIEIKILANKLFEMTYFFFCRIKQYEN